MNYACSLTSSFASRAPHKCNHRARSVSLPLADCHRGLSRDAACLGRWFLSLPSSAPLHSLCSPAERQLACFPFLTIKNTMRLRGQVLVRMELPFLQGCPVTWRPHSPSDTSALHPVHRGLDSASCSCPAPTTRTATDPDLLHACQNLPLHPIHAPELSQPAPH